MKSILFAATSFFVFAILTSMAYAAPSVCETFQAADDTVLKGVKLVNAFKDTLTRTEMGMIQTAILVGNPSEPLSARKAKSIFADEEFAGADGGYLSYFELTHNSRKVTVVKATFYPGDNEYGALFSYKKTEGGVETVSFIGTVEDSGLVCLKHM